MPLRPLSLATEFAFVCVMYKSNIVGAIGSCLQCMGGVRVWHTCDARVNQYVTVEYVVFNQSHQQRFVYCYASMILCTFTHALATMRWLQLAS